MTEGHDAGHDARFNHFRNDFEDLSYLFDFFQILCVLYIVAVVALLKLI